MSKKFTKPAGKKAEKKDLTKTVIENGISYVVPIEYRQTTKKKTELIRFTSMMDKLNRQLSIKEKEDKKLKSQMSKTE